MSQLQAIGLLLCGLAISLPVARSIRKGRYGPLSRSEDPLAFWGFVAFLLSVAAVGTWIAVPKMAV